MNVLTDASAPPTSGEIPSASPLPALGWREWVALPDLGIDSIKAKVDTGARTSSLHAYGIEPFERDGEHWVRFRVHPIQHDGYTTVKVETPLLEQRWVKSSSGHKSFRCVILTNVTLMGQTWPIELTLVRRDDMGFRMLLGREAVRGRFLVDPGLSFAAGRRKRRKKKKKKVKRAPAHKNEHPTSEHESL